LSKIILSLCDRSGNWPRPYAEAGYDVRCLDIEDGIDIRLMPLPDGPVHGILAAPPCTVFAISGQRWKRSTREMLDGISVVDACLRLILVAKPSWWCLENPQGTLRRYLGPPAFRFHPYEYCQLSPADCYTKKTCLWGNFVPPTPLFCGRQLAGPPTDRDRLKRLGQTANRPYLRSITPLGFARAFFQVNP
jgi:hypothetical protein